MKKPNFFIIGAPKSGTTSLAAYLRDHPEIFVSKPKEPFYFNTDSSYRDVLSLDAYNSLFEKACTKHKAVGEASVLYLYSKTAVPNILQYNPDAKFIVMLRNPVDMAYSWHYQLLYAQLQRIEDFKDAWNLQVELAESPQAKSWIRDPHLLLYGEICKLGDQIDRLLKFLSKEKLLIICFDDIKNNPKNVYETTLSFLHVSSDNRTDFPIYNENKINRFVWIRRLQNTLVKLKNKYFDRPTSITGVFNLLSRYNTEGYKRPSLDQEFRAELVEYFREDVQRLSSLINRDLSHWQ